MSTPLIQCQDLALGYETGLAVRHLTFTVNSGDYLCLVGENRQREIYPGEGLAGAFGSGVRHHSFFTACPPGRIGYLPQQTPCKGISPPRWKRWCSPAAWAAGAFSHSIPRG